MQDSVVATEEVVDKKVTTAPPEATPKFESGMTRQLNLAKKLETKSTPAEIKPSEQPEKKTYDYTVFRDLNDDDYKKYATLKEKDEATYYELLSNRNDMKKGQRLVSERERRIAELQSQKPEEELAKHREFVNGLKKDFTGTYKQYQKDFDLPEWDFVEKQASSGNTVQERIQQFQEVDLIPKIEKKFKLESGTFTYDANEAYKAGSPSYEYRLETEKYEKQLNSEYETNITRQQEIVGKVKQQTDADMKFLRETYFPNSDYESPEKADEAFIQYLSELDNIQEQIRKGDFNAEKNPFALRHIFRGIHFDSLVKAAVDKTVKDIHAQYNAKGLYLPNTELPTNVSDAKGSPAPVIPLNSSKGKYSPMHRRVTQNLS